MCAATSGAVGSRRRQTRTGCVVTARPTTGGRSSKTLRKRPRASRCATTATRELRQGGREARPVREAPEQREADRRQGDRSTRGGLRRAKEIQSCARSRAQGLRLPTSCRTARRGSWTSATAVRGMMSGPGGRLRGSGPVHTGARRRAATTGRADACPAEDRTEACRRRSSRRCDYPVYSPRAASIKPGEDAAHRPHRRAAERCSGKRMAALQ
jgi:hypothetical protein